MDEDESVVRKLSAAECREMLEAHEFGRLAFRLVDEVHIVPINYTAQDGRLLFRTGEGDKLLSVAMGSSVALEIDEQDEATARSVVVRGRARVLEEDELHLLEGLPLYSWVGALPDNAVEIVPEHVTGRAFTKVRRLANLPTDPTGR